jgi:hypothetical protein
MVYPPISWSLHSNDYTRYIIISNAFAQGLCSRLIFWRYLVWISFGTPAVLIEVLRGLSQSFQAHSRIVLRSHRNKHVNVTCLFLFLRLIYITTGKSIMWQWKTQDCANWVNCVSLMGIDFIYNVMYRSVARQRLSKHIPGETYTRNRTSIARQLISKEAFSTIERLCFLHGPCRDVTKGQNKSFELPRIGSSSGDGSRK